MPGGIINTGSHPALLWPGIKAVWGYTYDEFGTEYTDLFDTESSDKNYEEIVQVAGYGLAQIKPQGQSLTYDVEQQGATTRLTNVTIGLGYIVTMEELQDNLYEKVSKRRAAANARAMRLTKEYAAAAVYNRAFTSGYNGGDGVVLGSASHPLVFGGTGSNVPSTPADLSEAAIEDAMIAIMGFTDDRGLLAAIMPQSLIVSKNEFFNAHRILDSVYQSGSANNDINVLKATGMLPGGIKMNHYLTNARPWFIRNKVAGPGMVYQERMAVQFGIDNDFDTKSAKAASVERYCFGWGDWRALYCSNSP